MIHAGHRVSKDIDAFIHDPQYLSFLSPRLAGEAVWGCEAFNEAAHYLKLIFPEGEIDFIVAAAITDLKKRAEGNRSRRQRRRDSLSPCDRHRAPGRNRAEEALLSRKCAEGS
jgi:hypothetical protein